MSSLNKVTLIGRLGKDPEEKQFDNANMTTFSLATSEKFKTRNGESQEKTDWHNVVMFGKVAEIAAKYASKGSLVCVEGSINYREYEDKEGVKKWNTSINARNLVLLSPKSEQTNSQPQQTPDPTESDELPW